MDWNAFLAMGGYAAFVWPSYLLTLAVLAGLAAWSRLRHAAAIRETRLEQGDAQDQA